MRGLYVRTGRVRVVVGPLAELTDVRVVAIGVSEPSLPMLEGKLRGAKVRRMYPC